MNLHLNTKTPLALLALLAATATAQAACPSWPTASRFTFNGAEVKDNRTGLTWARCSVGQSWNGSACTGTASTHTHEQALQLAAGQSGWRLPTVKELASLADKGCSGPAIDSVAFPNIPSRNAYWSSSPYVGDAAYALMVQFSSGMSGGYNRSNGYAVRLVRTSQ